AREPRRLSRPHQDLQAPIHGRGARRAHGERLHPRDVERRQDRPRLPEVGMTVRVAGAGLLAVVMMAWLALATPTRADSPFTEEMLRVPFPAPSAAKLTLVARLYRPAGAGPFPLAVVNHGASRTD